MTAPETIVCIALIAAVTFITRAIPFMVFSGNKPIPRYIAYLGQVLAFSVMGMLIVYCLKSVSLTEYPHGLPEAIAVVFVASIHKWKHNLLASILSGTLLYMFLVQSVFES